MVIEIGDVEAGPCHVYNVYELTLGIPMTTRKPSTRGDSPQQLFGEQFTTTMRDAPALAAPERQEELRRLQEHHGIQISVEDGAGFAAQTDVESRRISLSERLCIRLWCHCYAYQVAREQHKVSNAREGRVWRADSEAARMLTWADRAVDEKRAPWPRALPRPEEMYVADEWISPRIVVLGLPTPPPLPTTATLTGRATRTLIGAVGWILLHEIAHLYYGHRPYSEKLPYESMAEEQQADHSAVTWLFGSDWLEVIEGARPGTAEDRLMAVLCALCFLCAEEVDPFSRRVEAHVDPFARLWRFLYTFVPPSEGNEIQVRVWRQATVVLAGLLQHRGFPKVPTADFGSSEFIAQVFEICGGRLMPSVHRSDNHV